VDSLPTFLTDPQQPPAMQPQFAQEPQQRMQHSSAPAGEFAGQGGAQNGFAQPEFAQQDFQRTSFGGQNGYNNQTGYNVQQGYNGGQPMPPQGDAGGARTISRPKTLDDAERQALIEALNANGGHRERTADALGISRRTLQYKLRKYGLTKRS